MIINMQLSEEIMLTSIGLISSGYDLYNKNDLKVLELIETIKNEYKDLEIINYFKKARTDTCSVNPYWPRGSAVYAASLFLTSNYEAIDVEKYIAFEKHSNSSGLWQDNDFIDWIKQLPYFLRTIKDHPSTDKIINLIKSYIKKYDIEFKVELNKVSEIIESFKADSEFQVVYLPNLLQAEQCTDYIKKEKTLYVVATKPRFSSMVHEYIHLALEPYRNFITDLYISYKDVPLFHKEKLSLLGYLWDEGIDSELRCIEEGFARGLTILISTMQASKKKNELEDLREDGFLVADKFIDFIGLRVKEDMLKEIIQSSFI